jgi:DNA-binding response OmpR family regulator
MAGDREKAMEAGCDDHDTKPVEISRLLGKIAALLKPGGDRATVTESGVRVPRLKMTRVPTGERRGHSLPTCGRN